MPAEGERDLPLEIGHVLFVDIVGYSKLLIDEQSELLQHLNEMVRSSEEVRAAETAGKLIRLATGDGMALVFRNNPEAPVQCAVELFRAAKAHAELQLRMGIHSGPINQVTDVNERANVTGAGINTAQRVMDCGDAGHILLSKRAADDLAQHRHWQPLLHDLGEVEVKHGLRLGLVNLYTDEVGNPALPQKLREQARRRVSLAGDFHPAGLVRRDDLRDRAFPPEFPAAAGRACGHAGRDRVSITGYLRHFGEKHRGASVREPEQRQGERLLRRRHSG